ncbi:hypothetical protein ACIPW5_38600 [Streptomyces sp. NPDC090077]|uniref:hypothetical protein n=1 Tax=Streptomyces sp. NPDC090077 TaxID=3365938 RepID=UPI00381EE497
MVDHDRQAQGRVVGVYPSPLVVRLEDAAGFQWIARTVASEADGPRPAGPAKGLPVVAGRVVVDVASTELRVGDQVLAQGRLLAIADLRYRHGATRTMILSNGQVAAAERMVRVYHPGAG